MSNSSSVSFLILGAYLEMGSVKYLWFLVVAAVYVLIVGSNVLLIVVICVNRTLHEPMYLFLCSLFVNELYGSSGLFPFLLLQLLSDAHAVSLPLCLLQIYCLYTYVNVEFCSLAVMSYDRFVAVCLPLQYRTIMTGNRVLVLTLSVWLYSLLKFLVTLSLSVRLTLCNDTLDTLFCRNYQLVKLSCSDTRVNNLYGLVVLVVSVLVPLAPIVYSYARILRVCSSGSRQTRQKAVSTCCPHLVSLLNFSFGCLFEILQSRFDMSHVPAALRVVLSLYFLVIQPVLNPLLYGVQMTQLRSSCRQLFTCRGF